MTVGAYFDVRMSGEFNANTQLQRATLFALHFRRSIFPSPHPSSSDSVRGDFLSINELGGNAFPALLITQRIHDYRHPEHYPAAIFRCIFVVFLLLFI